MVYSRNSVVVVGLEKLATLGVLSPSSAAFHMYSSSSSATDHLQAKHLPFSVGLFCKVDSSNSIIGLSLLQSSLQTMNNPTSFVTISN